MAIKALAPNTSKVDTREHTHKPEEARTSLQGFFNKFNNDWSMMFAGALAYSLLTAIVPILLAILSVLGFVLGPGTVDYVTNHIIFEANKALNQAINLQLKLVIAQLKQQAGILALIAIGTAFFGGSRLFVGLEGCLDLIYRVRPRKIIGQNVIAIMMIILFIILVPIMIFAATLPGLIQAFIASNALVRQIPLADTIMNNVLTLWLVGFTGGLIAAFLLFWAIYLIVPNLNIRLGSSWQGALVSALAMELFITIVFPFYVTHFMGNYAGQAGLAVILLVFFYYFAVILMLGAEVNAYFFEKVQPLPNDLATFVSTMAGTLNKDIPASETSPHVDPQPTERADRRHITEVRIEEQENLQKNIQKQNDIVQKELAKDKQQNQKNLRDRHKAQPNKIQTLVSVVLGSVLTMLIELLRQKQRGR
jgi:YihY family inner membrane protein